MKGRKQLDVKQIGVVGEEIVNMFHLCINPFAPIFMGDSNILHMKSAHPDDYLQYGEGIEHILAFPHYVGINPKDKSFEYVRIFKEKIVYIKLAIRPTKSEKYFARSLYHLPTDKMLEYISSGTLKRVCR